MMQITLFIMTLLLNIDFKSKTKDTPINLLCNIKPKLSLKPNERL